MRKELALVSLILVLSMSLASAGTLIAGKIYDSPDFENANAVVGANINVSCNGNIRTTQSLSPDGTYSVTYLNSSECPNNSTVTVTASKDGNSNTETGLVHDYSAPGLDLYVGVVNIALIPEFGVIVGALTILGAVGVFFVIRRK